MKLTIGLDTYAEMKMHSHALDTFKVLDILETNLYNESSRLNKEGMIAEREGVLISAQIYRDLMEEYGLYGILAGLEKDKDV